MGIKQGPACHERVLRRSDGLWPIHALHRAYATSFEGGSVPDIWDDVADAISSVGNYLKEHGWRAGDGVVVDAIVNDVKPAIFDAGLKPSLSVAELALVGVRPVETLTPSMMVTPLRLEEQRASSLVGLAELLCDYPLQPQCDVRHGNLGAESGAGDMNG